MLYDYLKSVQKVDKQIQNYVSILREKGLKFDTFEEIIPEKIGSYISSKCENCFTIIDAFPRVGSFSTQVKKKISL